MNPQFLDILNKKIEDQKASHVEALAGGVVKDYAEYRELCGVIRGLQTAQRELADLVRRVKESDNDD
jgi:hypothetical protein